MKAGQQKNILLLDNYDSFTYNLYHALISADIHHVTVIKNDEICPEEAGGFDAIVISPGPGYPATSGICCEVIRHYARQKSILGICLGHQAIAEVFGGSLYHLPAVRHGVQVTLNLRGEDRSFKGIQGEICVGLYHSWAVSETNLPDCLEITALSSEGIVMALAHREYNIHGWQFHPESIMTPLGVQMLRNWAACD